ncbi:MAG: response regulator [Pseudotabrizicola sp.]|uniref:response regulator n=1 Tax=Pseudotabrizicola sp. TaxID=2939647 RepID=UPI002721FAC7|nr:response regulator [Pseudotabrizicola sp.]MDO9640111.1 response regulator [Pseudotabrizicola sp.]
MTSHAGPLPAVVLLAEDDEINQQIVRHLLAEFPFIELGIAADGKQALETAISQRFDLMIFDRHMPLISGDRVIRHLKAASTINTMTPMIQFTADVDHASTPGVGDQADAVIPKPIQSDVFRSTVLRLLGRAIETL